MTSLLSAIPRIDDRTAIAIFDEIRSAHAPVNMSMQAAGVDAVNFLNPDGASARVIEELRKSDSFLITHLSLGYPNLSISFIRNQDAGRIHSFYDEIRVDHHQNQPGLDPAQRLSLIQLLNSKIRLGNVERKNDAAGMVMDDLQSIYHSTVLSLQTSFSQQIEKITNWTVEQTTAIEKLKIKLADETAAERERLSKEHDTKSEALRTAGEELEARRKEIDDRAYMHARRGIRSDLQKTIKGRQEKFTLTPETRRLRLPVHVALITLLIVLAAANAATLYAIINLDVEKATLSTLVWAFAKQTIVAIIFVATLFFYIRWMNRWFEQHASAEFLLKQFELDIDRASWVVETAMEWRRDQQAEIPPPLLDGIARNLFTDRGIADDSHTAADDLASALVGNASQLKLKVGENELNFDRKGLANLGKA
ncbi:hypothetical protein ABIF97_003590 [Bradyrhizobium japonicum]